MINSVRFMLDMAAQLGNSDDEPVVLECKHRPDVASRFWWTIEWTGADGQRHIQAAQELTLCLWRAAENEMQVERQVEMNQEPFA
jgi:3-mercaptopyruvate sulfurtransferase SseA